MTQAKEQNKSTEADTKEIEVYELFDKDCKISVIKMRNEFKENNTQIK